MHDILDLPYKAEGALEYAATPPDFEEYFEERQLQIAEIGFLAAGLAERLREHAGLPPRTVNHWDPTA